jgi:biotin operon repressor
LAVILENKDLSNSESRRYLYEKYIKNSVCFISKNDLLKVIGVTRKELDLDIAYLHEKYGYSFSNKNVYTPKQVYQILGIEISENGEILNSETKEVLCKSEKYNREKIKKTKEDLKNKELLSSLNKHKEYYLNLMDEFGYVPPISFIVETLCETKEVIEAELSELGLKPLSFYDYNVLIEEQKNNESALKNIEVYKEFYFDSLSPLSETDLCIKLGLSVSTILKQIKFLEQLGYHRRVEKEEKIIDRPKKMDLTEGRHLYYLESFFNANRDNYKTLEEMSKELGIKPSTILYDLRYLRKKYGYFRDFRDFRASTVRNKELLVDGVIYTDRYEFLDLNYFNSLHPLGIRDMVVLLNTTAKALYSMIAKMKSEGYEKAKFEVGDDGLIRKTCYELRLKNYFLFFKKNKCVDSLSELANILCLPNTTVKDDFNAHNLYTLFPVKTGKHIINNELTERLTIYDSYFNETENPVKTITELSNVLSIRRHTVLCDFSIHNLYEKYNIEKVE